MAHFACLNDEDAVIRVIVIPDSQEERGEEYITNDLGLQGRWIQCSYNGSIRKRYPGKGYTYDSLNDVFIEPKPSPSWILDQNFEWQAPVPKPETDRHWFWDEDSFEWRDLFITPDKITPVVILGDE